MARVRLDRAALVRVMRQRWADAGRPPWGTLAGDPVEDAKARLLAPHLRGVRSVLDCGCGGGDFLALVDPARELQHVIGVDVAEEAIARARLTRRYSGLICAHVDDVADMTRGRFDAVMFGEMLYY